MILTVRAGFVSRWVPNRRWIAALVMFAIGSFAVGQANAILIISGAKPGVVTPKIGNAASLGTGLVTIARNSAWQVNNPLGRGAVWVSNADTGQGGSLFQPKVLTSGGNADLDVIFKITESFTITSSGHIDFTVWADDTARIFFDGGLLINPNFNTGTCAAGVISCQPDMFFNFSRNIAAGTHSIDIDTYQTGSNLTTITNPFGVLYSGEVTVPEPTTLLLMGMGLAGLGFLRRSRTTA